MTPFGHYLESLRRSRGLQQKQLAALLDVNPCYVSALEKGRKGPPTEIILNKIITSLKLDKPEQELMSLYAEQSVRTFRMPNSMAREEYALVHELKQYLGSLSREQIAIIQNALRVRNNDIPRAGALDGGNNTM